MTLKRKPLTTALNAALHDGLAIPAHPLALTKERKLDERRQRALTRYYLASGAGGIAVAVHSTQFEIRNPEIGSLRARVTSRCGRGRTCPAKSAILESGRHLRWDGAGGPRSSTCCKLWL